MKLTTEIIAAANRAAPFAADWSDLLDGVAFFTDECRAWISETLYAHACRDLGARTGADAAEAFAAIKAAATEGMG